MTEKKLQELREELQKDGHTVNLRLMLDAYAKHSKALVTEPQARIISEHVQNCNPCKNAVEQTRTKHAEERRILKAQRRMKKARASLERAKKLSDAVLVASCD